MRCILARAGIVVRPLATSSHIRAMFAETSRKEVSSVAAVKDPVETLPAGMPTAILDAAMLCSSTILDASNAAFATSNAAENPEGIDFPESATITQIRQLHASVSGSIPIVAISALEMPNRISDAEEARGATILCDANNRNAAAYASAILCDANNRDAAAYASAILSHPSEKLLLMHRLLTGPAAVWRFRKCSRC